MRHATFNIFVLWAVAAASLPTSAATWYVSPQGNDDALGQKDAPFATLERARDEVRKSGEAGEIVLHGGTYRLARPVTLTTQDNGVTIRAEEGETPVLTGGRVIEGWKAFRDKILVAKMPGWTSGDRRPCQLFYKGQRQIVARYPNFDSNDPLYGGWAFVERVRSPVEFESAADVFGKAWSKPAQGEVFIFPWLCWVSDIAPIATVDHDTRSIRTARPVGDPDPRLAAGTHYRTPPQTVTVGNRFFVQNLLEELDQPGEWCFDSDDGAIYFWPQTPGGELRDGDVAIPVTDRLIVLKGTPDAPIRNVTIRGLRFTQTLSMFPPRYLECNAPNSRGFALYLENSAECTIEDNAFDQVGGDAVRLEHASTRNAIRRNTIGDAGASGILLNNTDFGGFEFPETWNPELLRSLAKDRPWARGNEVTDNVIERCGAIDKMSAGIKIHGLNCVNNIIGHNLIHHVPHAAVQLTFSLGRNIVEFNHMHHTCLEMSDVGPFVSNRVFPVPDVPELAEGTVVRYNLIHDVVGCAAYETANKSGGSAAGGRIRTPYYTFGIYGDNSPRDVLVFGNIVAGPTWASVAFPVAVATSNRVENNILLPSGSCQAMTIAAGVDNQFVRNIVVHRNATVKPEHAWPAAVVKDCNRNVYWCSGNSQYTDGTTAVEAWRKQGMDADSIVADPLFVDLEGGDYRLRPESPALKLGFEPIPVDQIGPRRAGGQPVQAK